MTHHEYPSEDRRVQRTRKLIQQALIELTIQKGFAAVTVRDIAEYAGINRATFYRHFQDKFDLIDQYGQEVYQLLDAPMAGELSSEGKRSGSGASSAGLVRMLEHIRAHAKFYRVMLGKKGDPAFAGKIQYYVEKRMRQALPGELHDKPLADLCLNYISSGSLGLVVWWLEHAMPYSPEELATLSYRLSAADLQAVLGYATSHRG